MKTAYKLRVSYSVVYKHSCDCEFCDIDDEYTETGRETETVVSESLEDAKGIIAAGILDEYKYNDVRDFKFELLDSLEVPEDKYFLLDRVYSVNNGEYLTDGFVMLKQEYIVHMGKPEKEADNPFTHMQLDYPLGKYIIDDNTFVFEEAFLNADFIKPLHKMGIVVWAVKNGGETEPFALAKDGEHVGAIMPMHRRKENGKTRKRMLEIGPFSYQPGIPAKEASLWNDRCTTSFLDWNK